MTKTKLPPHAGYVDVSKLLIVSHETGKSVDIKGNYISFSVSENLYNPFLDGYIDIVDSYGMIYPTASERTDDNFFHIRGEEYLHIEYYDYNSFDDPTELKKETYFIYAIEEIEMLDGKKETGLQYRLFFTSAQKVFSDTKRISKAYRNMSYSEIVQSIYDEYYTNVTNDLCRNKDNNGNILKIQKDLILEETKAKFTIVIPSLTPEEAIQFIGKRAYSEKNSSSFFMFFETRDNFYFCTTEYLAEKNRLNLIDEDVRFTYSSGQDDNSPTGQDRAMTIISNGTFPSMNSLEAIKAQAYSKRISEIDLANRDINHFYYQYKDNYLGYDNVEERPQLQNSKKFISETTGDVNHIDEGYVFKDYAGIGEAYTKGANHDRQYPYYKETMSTKPVFAYHFMKATMSGEIKGRDKLFPGSLVNIDIPEYAVTSMKNYSGFDKYFGGTQMIVSLDHVIVDNVWTSSVSFSKALRGGGDSPNAPGSNASAVTEEQPTPESETS
jgi:hypothetical protein